MSPKQLCGLKIHINVRVNDNACRVVSKFWGLLPSPRHMAFSNPVKASRSAAEAPSIPSILRASTGVEVNSEVRACLFLDSPEPAEWGEWGDCSITCGAGWRSRYRQCEDCDRNHYRNVQSQPCVINYYCPRECHSSGSTLLKRLNLLPRTYNSMIIAYFIELMSFCTTCILGGDRSLVILYYSSFSVYIFLSIYLIKHCIH